MLLELGLALERTDGESPDMLAQAARTLMTAMLRISLNMMISSSDRGRLQSGGEGYWRALRSCFAKERSLVGAMAKVRCQR
jgi:hypothetical protein